MTTQPKVALLPTLVTPLKTAVTAVLRAGEGSRRARRGARTSNVTLAAFPIPSACATRSLTRPSSPLSLAAREIVARPFTTSESISRTGAAAILTPSAACAPPLSATGSATLGGDAAFSRAT